MIRNVHVVFSTDGCRGKADVEGRREFLNWVVKHQQRAHHFTDDDLREMRVLRADVRPFRLRRYIGALGRPFYFPV